MDVRTLWGSGQIRTLFVGVAAVIVIGLCSHAGNPLDAQGANATGAISGTVTADRGDVRALRVRATDTEHGISFVVFTNKAGYRILNLPAGMYAVRIGEPSFDAPAQTVSVKPGATATVNLAVKATGTDEVYREYGVGGSGYVESGSATSDAVAPAKELVDYDVLYPPASARKVLEKTCFACHGVNFFHGRKLSEAMWRQGINKMFRIGMMRAEILPDAQREEVIKYLAANFGPDSKPRDLKKDRLVRDEAALAEAVYIEYDLPPTASTAPAFANGIHPHRGTHSVYVSEKYPGVIWASDQFGNAILRLDTRDPDPKHRFREYRIENPKNINTHPHGIVEEGGRVYWVERLGDHIGELNPETGEIHRYPIPTKGGHAHTIRADSEGNLWYSFWAATSKVGRFEIKSKTFTEFDSDKRFNGYGLTTDRQGRVWQVGMSAPANDVPRVHMYNPENGRWSSFETSGSTRRVAVDSKGKVWVCQYFGSAISMIEMTDRINGKVTNYPMPLKHGNPYEIWPDLDDNLWMSVSAYGSLVRFDQRTKTFSYFPYSQPGSHTPKMEVDSQGTLWFALNNSQPIVAFKPKGNVPRSMSQAARLPERLVETVDPDESDPADRQVSPPSPGGLFDVRTDSSLRPMLSNDPFLRMPSRSQARVAPGRDWIASVQSLL